MGRLQTLEISLTNLTAVEQSMLNGLEASLKTLHGPRGFCTILRPGGCCRILEDPPFVFASFKVSKQVFDSNSMSCIYPVSYIVLFLTLWITHGN
jgi:hypothetical protein